MKVRLAGSLFVLLSVVIFEGNFSAYAAPATCSGPANSVLSLTGNGTVTSVTNTSQEIVHTTFSNALSSIAIDLAPGETKPISVGGQGYAFIKCDAHF